MLAARREEIDGGVYEIGAMQECKGAGMKPLDLILGGHREVRGSTMQQDSIEVVCKRIQNEEAR